MVEGYKKRISPIIKMFSDFLGERRFFAGDKVSQNQNDFFSLFSFPARSNPPLCSEGILK